MITLQHCLALSIVIFCLGTIGFVERRNLLFMCISVMVMLGSSLLAVLAFARWNFFIAGESLVVMMSLIIVSQVVLMLGAVLFLHRGNGSLNIDENDWRGR